MSNIRKGKTMKNKLLFLPGILIVMHILTSCPYELLVP